MCTARSSLCCLASARVFAPTGSQINQSFSLVGTIAKKLVNVFAARRTDIVVLFILVICVSLLLVYPSSIE